MRSNASTPEGQWPHDMLITVDDQPLSLLELLWLREAYGLGPRGADLPPLLLDPPPALPRSAINIEEHEKQEWERAWPRVWHAAVAHVGEVRNPVASDELDATNDGSIERADLLRRIIGPRWRDTFGHGAFDNNWYRAWLQGQTGGNWAATRTRAEDEPEQRDLAGLVPAWRAGLIKIVTIPCLGEFTRRVGKNTLLLTAQTRQNSDSYRYALSTFT